MRSEAKRVLDGLFSETVAVAATALDDESTCPYVAELDLIASATWRRRREFLAGRACAHAALRTIGRDGAPIGRGPMREPVWPAGVVGSISHSGELAGAVVARAGDAWGVGLDIELLDPPLEAAVQRLVLAPGELTHGRADEPTLSRASELTPGWADDLTLNRHLPKMAFAIKECVYKCLYPRTRWRLDFHDVLVEIDPAARCWRAAVDERFRLGGAPLAVLEGRLATCDRYVLVGLLMASAGPDRGTGRSPHGRRRPRACSSASG